MLPQKLPKFQESQLEKHGMYLNNATFSARGTAMHTRLIRLYPLILPNSQFSGAVVLCQFSDSENTDFFNELFWMLTWNWRFAECCKPRNLKTNVSLNRYTANPQTWWANTDTNIQTDQKPPKTGRLLCQHAVILYLAKKKPQKTQRNHHKAYCVAKVHSVKQNANTERAKHAKGYS